MKKKKPTLIKALLLYIPEGTIKVSLQKKEKQNHKEMKVRIKRKDTLKKSDVYVSLK